MAPLSSCGVADRKVMMRGRGPASIRRRPSAWSKSKLAKAYLAQHWVMGGARYQQGQFGIAVFWGGLAAEGASYQRHRVGQVQVFRHALAVGCVEQAQLVADHHVQRG